MSVILMIYVHDLVLIDSLEVDLDHINMRLRTKFKMTYLALKHLCLVLIVYQIDRKIFVAHTKYACFIVKPLGMENCKASFHTNGG